MAAQTAAAETGSGAVAGRAREGNVVMLNVGGRRFAALRSTLSSASHFFANVLNGEFACDEDETGAVFLDRDPDLFAVVLQYLRSGEWPSVPDDAGRVLREAKFYGIPIAPCDFTIKWLRSEAEHRKWEEHAACLRQLCDFVQTEFEELLAGGQDLVLAVLPGLSTMKEMLGGVRLKTGPDTTEQIDLDKLQVVPTTAEGIRYFMDDQLYTVAQRVPHGALKWHMRNAYQYSITADTGSVYFPYSSSLRRCEDAVAVAHSGPVYSKLHGTLHVARCLPCFMDDAGTSQVSILEGVDTPSASAGDRFANLHTRYYQVCEARYYSWDGDHDRLMSSWRPNYSRFPATPGMTPGGDPLKPPSDTSSS